MTDQSPDRAGANGADSHSNEDRVWLALWRLTVAVFVALLALCGYWIVSLGFEGAIAQGRFHYVLFAAIIAGILILGRFTMRSLTGGIAVDRRNAGLMDVSRPNWFMRMIRRDRER